jgi:hypothetical protein
MMGLLQLAVLHSVAVVQIETGAKGTGPTMQGSDQLNYRYALSRWA